jgi:protein-tyrosine phosphatase
MLERGWVSVVATDAHNLLHRGPVLSDARAWLKNFGGQGLADQLTIKVPAKILGLDSLAYPA